MCTKESVGFRKIFINYLRVMGEYMYNLYTENKNYINSYFIVLIGRRNLIAFQQTAPVMTMQRASQHLEAALMPDANSNNEDGSQAKMLSGQAKSTQMPRSPQITLNQTHRQHELFDYTRLHFYLMMYLDVWLWRTVQSIVNSDLSELNALTSRDLIKNG